MAETIVQVNSGSGPKLHGWDKVIGANTTIDQFVLPGEFPYAAYTVILENVSAATGNDHLLQIMAGSSLNVRIRSISIEQSSNAGAVNLLTTQIMRLTTAGTGGTVLTPAKHDSGDAAAGATAMTIPTVKGAESTVIKRATCTARAAFQSTAEDSWQWVQQPGVKPLIIPAGTSNGIAIKTLTAIATATWNIHVEIVETAFL